MKEAIEWQMRRSPDQIMHEREMILQEMETSCQKMWAQGICQDWFKNCDKHVRAVAKSVNGPLMEKLAKSTRYHDAKCVELMREGMLIPTFTCIL